MALSQPVLGRNATPAWGLEAPEPAQRDVLAAARKVDLAKRRADDQRRQHQHQHQQQRPPHPRRQSLRRVKDSREQLRSTRARGTSNATTDSTPSIAPGRSFTVANINNGIIYLRYVWGGRGGGRGHEGDLERECGGAGGWGMRRLKALQQPAASGTSSTSGTSTSTSTSSQQDAAAGVLL